MAKRNQQSTTTTSNGNRATNDGACRCDGFNNVWGQRTTHWSSQCDDERERTSR